MKNLIKYFMVSMLVLIKRRKYNRLIKAIGKRRNLGSTSLDHNIISKHYELWRPLSKAININWCKYFCVSTDRHDERFVPPDIYYNFLEPVLNNKKVNKALDDKNFYDLFFPDIKKPAVYVRCIKGIYYDRHYYRIADHLITSEAIDESIFDSDTAFLIVKPAMASGQGRLVKKLLFRDKHLYDSQGHRVTLSMLGKAYAYDFLIQQYVIQHDVSARFNPSSLNSIRVFTYRSVKDDEIIPLHIVQRIGSAESITDGHVSLGIDSSGNYNSNSFDTSGNKLDSINGIRLDSLEPFPFISKLSDCALKIAMRILHSRLLGIDLAVDVKGDVVLMEVNNNSIGVHKTQLCGGPLFKDYTNEVIAFCASHKRSFTLYAEI